MLLSFSRHSEVVLTSDAEEANKQAGHRGLATVKGRGAPWGAGAELKLKQAALKRKWFSQIQCSN